MKTFVVVAALVALCSGHVIPRDNEEENRYVWMPDAEGTSVLMDLDEPLDEELLKTRSGADNHYWLHTRRNPHFPQVIVHGNSNSVVGSNYNSNSPLIVIVHGWKPDANASLNPYTFLSALDCNVIVVDWHALANSNYNTAVAGVRSVGEHLGNFLTWLINHGGNWNQIHLVGFGLGAHVVGIAGLQTGGRPGRITGLDPAGFRWRFNPNRLRRQSGIYVEVIHTDGRGFGILDPSGDADFYPYGGQHPQPGCLTHMCSHNRAIELFEATVRFNRMYARECVDLWQALQGRCFGALFPMGNLNLFKRGKGIFSLWDTRYPYKTSVDKLLISTNKI